MEFSLGSAKRLAQAARIRAAGAIGRLGEELGYTTQRVQDLVRVRSSDLYAASRPPTGEIADIPVFVTSEWNTASIRAAVVNHIQGQFGQASLLAEAMLADDRVMAAVNGRTKAVTKCEVSVAPSKYTTGKKTQIVADEIKDNWEEIFPESIIEQILQWQIFSGFCLLELVWTFHNSRWMPRLKVWHPYFIYYRIDIRCYVALTLEDGPIEIQEDNGDPKWFLYTPYQAYRGWVRGAVRSVAIPWIVRQFALRDWGRYSEAHGLPQKKVKVPAQAPAEDKARFFAAIRRLGAENAFLLPVPNDGKGAEWDVELLEAKADTWQAFKGLREACDQSITLAIRGTNLTTEVKGGSLAASKTHKDEDSDFAQSDCRKLAQAFRNQVLSLYTLYNYGDPNLAPIPTLEAAPEEDKKTESETMLNLSNAVKNFETQGWTLDREEVRDRFGVPISEQATEDTTDVSDKTTDGDPGSDPSSVRRSARSNPRRPRQRTRANRDDHGRV